MKPTRKPYFHKFLVPILAALLICLRIGIPPARAVHIRPLAGPLNGPLDGMSDPSAILLDGLLACETAIDLTACALLAADLGRVYADLLHSHPELFHVALRLSFASREIMVDGETVRLVAEVYPVYTLTDTDLTAARTLYRDTLKHDSLIAENASKNVEQDEKIAAGVRKDIEQDNEIQRQQDVDRQHDELLKFVRNLALIGIGIAVIALILSIIALLQ